jgi:D-arginine dehydrogenase
MQIVIIGAGIAGASCAYYLAPHAHVTLLEGEAHPGVHSTGRSAALYFESYGAPSVRALTLASRAFLEHPPPGFADGPILSPRGALIVAQPGQEELLNHHLETVASVSALARSLNAAQVMQMLPILRPECVLGGVLEPDAMDIDVNRLHMGYLRGAQAAGATLLCQHTVSGFTHHGDATAPWEIHTAQGHHLRADVVINAAGAWCDEVAKMAHIAPIGLVPKRRSAFVFDPPAGVNTQQWPCFIAADESFYIKPDAGLLLGSPANADPVPAHDVHAEELDIAIAIDRITSMTNLVIRRPRRVWAGLRSFVADDCLVGGWDAKAPGFFWCAGQGGYGIQTSAGMGKACAQLVLGQALTADLRAHGLTAQMLSPARLAVAT